MILASHSEIKEHFISYFLVLCRYSIYIFKVD